MLETQKEICPTPELILTILLCCTHCRKSEMKRSEFCGEKLIEKGQFIGGVTRVQKPQREPASFLQILKGLLGQRSYDDCFSESLGIEYEIICISCRETSIIIKV